MHDDDDDGGPSAAAVSSQLIGALAAQDSLTLYEHGTGFHCGGLHGRPSTSSASAQAHLAAKDAPSVDVGQLRDTWLECVEGWMGDLDDEPLDDGELVHRPVAPKTPIRGKAASRPPPVASPSCTPSTDMIDLTSDSGHSYDLDSVSSLASPVPRSSSPSPVMAKKPLAPFSHNHHHQHHHHRSGPLLPHIRRLSTTSLPTTSFSSPSVSPGPLEHNHLAYPSSLSLDLDYPSSTPDDEDDSSLCASISALATSVSDIHIEDAKDIAHGDPSSSLGASTSRDTAASPNARVRKTKTRTLVEQMRRDAEMARSTTTFSEDKANAGPGESAARKDSANLDTPSTPTAGPSKPSVPSEPVEQPIYVASPGFARAARAPSVLPRCSDDIKDDEQDWWTLYDTAPAMHSPPPLSRTAAAVASGSHTDAHGWIYAPGHDADAFNRAFRFPVSAYQSMHPFISPPSVGYGQPSGSTHALNNNHNHNHNHNRPPAPSLTPDDFPALPAAPAQPADSSSSSNSNSSPPARKRGKKTKKGLSAWGSMDSKCGSDEEKKAVASAQANAQAKAQAVAAAAQAQAQAVATSKRRTPSASGLPTPATAMALKAPSAASGSAMRHYAPSAQQQQQQQQTLSHMQYPGLFAMAPLPPPQQQQQQQQQSSLSPPTYGPSLGGYAYAAPAFAAAYGGGYPAAGANAYPGHHPSMASPPVAAAFAGYVQAQAQAQAQLQHARASAAAVAAAAALAPTPYGMYAAVQTMQPGVQGYFR